jgi:nitrogen fixation protein NifU and related proteins
MTLASITALFVVLFFFVLSWYGLSYLLSPRMENADALARVTGNCGDTMEIGLRMKDGCVAKTHHWTDGCTMSRHCVESAARLAHGKSAAELKKINMSHIIDDIGHIPDSHLHCAQLAETVLHKAADSYSARRQV